MKHFIVPSVLLLFASFSFAQGNVNYDETIVPDFILPDPLTFNNGTKVTTVDQWENLRRAELLEMFSSQMYGRTPQEKIRVTYETLSLNPSFLNGKASARQVKFLFTNGSQTHEAVLLLVRPKQPQGKVPVFVAYNYKGNHSINPDPSILLPSVLSLPGIPEYWRWAEGDQERGCQSNRWPLEKIGGEGKQFWSDGRNWPLPVLIPEDWNYSQSRLLPDTHELFGQRRMEISPAESATDDCFLHLLQVSDISQKPMVNSTAWKNDESVGVNFA